jgi:hypothetical protein
MNFIDANGQRVYLASIGVPVRGAWAADLMLARGTALSSPVRLTIGNLTLVGAVIRQAPFADVQYARLVAGAAGWRKPVTAQSYSHPAGLQLSTVLRDVAASVGEQVSLPVDRTIGTHFVREAGTSDDPAPASRVLRQLVGNGWYVDNAGVTQVTDRVGVAILSPFTVESFDAAKGELVIATEDYASWLPANTFSAPVLPGTQTISFVRINSANTGRLRLMVLVTP